MGGQVPHVWHVRWCNALQISATHAQQGVCPTTQLGSFSSSGLSTIEVSQVSMHAWRARQTHMCARQQYISAPAAQKGRQRHALYCCPELSTTPLLWPSCRQRSKRPAAPTICVRTCAHSHVQSPAYWCVAAARWAGARVGGDGLLQGSTGPLCTCQ